MRKTTQLMTMAIAMVVIVSSANASIFFDANFDGTPVTDLSGSGYGGGGFAAAITKANLDAGTAVGDWTVSQTVTAPTNNTAKAAIQGVDAGNVTNKALRFGIDGGFVSNSTILTGNLSTTLDLSNAITVSFDTYLASGQKDRPVFLTGLDSIGRELFQLEFHINSTRFAYRDASDTRQLLGTATDTLNRGSSNTNHVNADYDPTKNKTVAVTINASSFDVSLDGSTLNTGIAFKDVNADGLDQLTLGIGGSKFTGIFVDNMLVTQEVSEIPEPASLAMGLVGLTLVAGRRRR